MSVTYNSGKGEVIANPVAPPLDSKKAGEVSNKRTNRQIDEQTNRLKD